MIKKVSAIIMSVILLFFITSCSTNTRVPQSHYTVAMVLPTGVGYVEEMKQQAQKQAEETMQEHSQVDIIITQGATSAEQVTAIGKVNEENDLDMLIVCPIDAESVRNAVKSISNAGVEVIIYDKLIDNAAGTIDMMPDRSGIATATAKYIQSYFANDETVGYLVVASDKLSASTAMLNTFYDTLSANKFVQKGDTIYGNYTQQDAKNAVATWLKTASQEDVESLKLIVTQYDEMAKGILNALEEYKGAYTLDVKLVTSIGADKDTLKLYSDTKLETKLFTMYYSPSMIRETIKLSMNLLIGDDFDIKKSKDGVYLIPSFSVSNAQGADMSFEDYTASGYYIERYPTEKDNTNK